MWLYEKKLAYPVHIEKKDLRMAKMILAQYGGPDSQISAAMTYLNQRYSMPDERGMALLNDIGTEELAHIEMLATMFTQLIKNATIEELKEVGLDSHYIEHGNSVFPCDPNGIPYSSAYIETSGNWLADIESDIALEQRAKVTYEHLINMTNDPELLAPLYFLRQREIVHYERLKELKEYYTEKYKE
jgi:spore coat protein JC